MSGRLVGGEHITSFHFRKANTGAVSVVGSNLDLAEVVGSTAVELS